MTAMVQRLVKDALALPAESRTELVEAILESTVPSKRFVDVQISIVKQRMENVRNGVSEIIDADEAHRQVRTALRSAK